MSFLSTYGSEGPLHLDSPVDENAFPQMLLSKGAEWVEATTGDWSNWPYRDILMEARMGLIEEGIVHGYLYAEHSEKPGARYVYGSYIRTSQGLFIICSTQRDMETLTEEGFVPSVPLSDEDAKWVKSHVVDHLLFFPGICVSDSEQVDACAHESFSALEIVAVGGEIQQCDVVQRAIPLLDKAIIRVGVNSA